MSSIAPGLFAAFLGYNPVQNLLGAQTLHALPAAQEHWSDRA
jgi:hypothetical protein